MDKNQNLSQKFEEYVAKINQKLVEATEALRQANKLAHEANLPALIMAQWLRDHLYESEDDSIKAREKVHQMSSKLNLIDVKNLECELSEAGWSTSSSYC